MFMLKRTDQKKKLGMVGTVIIVYYHFSEKRAESAFKNEIRKFYILKDYLHHQQL